MVGDGMNQSFVEALNELMAGSGISNNELGRRIEVDAAQVGRWRKGRGRPRPENIVRAAGVFGVDHRWLWSLAYPEGVHNATGPTDPHWSAFIAEIEAGWRLMDDATRELAERGARALFAVQPVQGASNRHRDGASTPRSGGRRALDAHTRPGDDPDTYGSVPTVYSARRASLAGFSLENVLAAIKHSLQGSSPCAVAAS